MQLFSSAISAVPPSQLESARMVGANTWQQLRRRRFCPNIKGHMLTNTLLITLWTFNTFTPYLLTAGGPNGQSDILSVYIYQTAIPGGQLGTGCGDLAHHAPHQPRDRADVHARLARQEPKKKTS